MRAQTGRVEPRNLPPFDFQHAVHRLINAVGSLVVTAYVWAILSFVISSVLWFAMVVVIYPEQAQLDLPWQYSVMNQWALTDAYRVGLRWRSRGCVCDHDFGPQDHKGLVPQAVGATTRIMPQTNRNLTLVWHRMRELNSCT